MRSLGRYRSVVAAQRDTEMGPSDSNHPPEDQPDEHERSDKYQGYALVFVE